MPRNHLVSAAPRTGKRGSATRPPVKRVRNSDTNHAPRSAVRHADSGSGDDDPGLPAALDLARALLSLLRSGERCPLCLSPRASDAPSAPTTEREPEQLPAVSAETAAGPVPSEPPPGPSWPRALQRRCADAIAAQLQRETDAAERSARLEWPNGERPDRTALDAFHAQERDDLRAVLDAVTSYAPVIDAGVALRLALAFCRTWASEGMSNCYLVEAYDEIRALNGKEPDALAQDDIPVEYYEDVDRDLGELISALAVANQGAAS